MDVERGGRHKGQPDAVSVIKPASTNTSQVYSRQADSWHSNNLCVKGESLF